MHSGMNDVVMHYASVRVEKSRRKRLSFPRRRWEERAMHFCIGFDVFQRKIYRFWEMRRIRFVKVARCRRVKGFFSLLKCYTLTVYFESYFLGNCP